MNGNWEYIYAEENTVETEIVPGVYLVNEEGILDVDDFEGRALYLYMDYSTAEKILSEEAIKAGDAEGGWLYYSAPYRYTIPLHELLTSHYINDEELIRLHDMEEMIQYGKILCTDYFGELEYAKSTRKEKPVKSQRLLNGFDAFLYADGGVELVIHEEAADYFISADAKSYGAKCGFFFHFQNDICAIPLYELSDDPEFESLTADEDEILSVLKQKFPFYLLANLKQKICLANFIGNLMSEDMDYLE